MREWVPWSDRHDSPGWYVEKNGCYSWAGATTKNGYGLAWDPMAKKLRLVRRIVWERAYGPVPDGMELRADVREPQVLQPIPHDARRAHQQHGAEGGLEVPPEDPCAVATPEKVIVFRGPDRVPGSL
jgi:hypothetical protein